MDYNRYYLCSLLLYRFVAIRMFNKIFTILDGIRGRLQRAKGILVTTIKPQHLAVYYQPNANYIIILLYISACEPPSDLSITE